MEQTIISLTIDFLEEYRATLKHTGGYTKTDDQLKELIAIWEKEANRAETLVIPQGELNVCPFCGGNAHLEFDDTYTKPFGHYVECNKCAATSGSCDSKENAIKTWNKRANREPQTV